jgi:hypothetical protein
VEEPQVQEKVAVKTAPVVEQPKPKKDSWEIKDRTYYLLGRLKPLSHIIKAADIYYFDEEKGYERELKYTKNQKTCFVDEMKGDQRLDHIIFRNGTLSVHRGLIFEEFNAVKVAVDEVAILEMEIAALNAAQNLDIDIAEAVMRVEIGSKVSTMSSKELKRDLLLYAKKNPKLFLELVNDENVVLRNFGIKATEMGILKLSSDQRTFSWGSNDRKLMNVPFDEHPYSALAAWFKTDEGMEIYSNIEKRLK